MSILESAKRVIRIEREALHEMENRIGDNFENAVKLILQSEGRVIVTGMGKSGAIAMHQHGNTGRSWLHQNQPREGHEIQHLQLYSKSSPW